MNAVPDNGTYLFYLGTHEVAWLSRFSVPLMVSHRRLSRFPRRTPWRPAATRWALDSGGFSELTLYGTWRTPEAEYGESVATYQAEIGRLDWAAPQDWMCEPIMLARTGLSVSHHQGRTVESVCSLRRS